MSSLVNKTNVGHKVTWLKRGLLAVASSFLLITVGCEPQVPLVSSEDEAAVDIQGAAFEGMTKILVPTSTRDKRDSDDPSREGKAFSLNLATSGDDDRPDGLSSYDVAIANCASGYTDSSVELLSNTASEDSALNHLEFYEGDSDCTVITNSFILQGQTYNCVQSGSTAGAEVSSCTNATSNSIIDVTNSHSNHAVINDSTAFEFELSSSSYTANDQFNESEVEHIVSGVYIDQNEVMSKWSLQHMELLGIEDRDASGTKTDGFFRFVLRCDDGVDSSEYYCGASLLSDLDISLNASSVSSLGSRQAKQDIAPSNAYDPNSDPLSSADSDGHKYVTAVSTINTGWDNVLSNGSGGYNGTIASQIGDLVIDISCADCFSGGTLSTIYLLLEDPVEAGSSILHNEWTISGDSYIKNPSDQSSNSESDGQQDG